MTPGMATDRGANMSADPGSGMASREVTAGDRSVAYLEGGGEPPLLLIHGFPFDKAAWRRQIDVIGDYRRVLAPDLPGFGDSEGPPEETIEGMADAMASFLDGKGVSRAVVGGLSMGGYVALAMWRRHPERMAGMILADSRAGPDTESGRAGRYQVIAAVEQQGVASATQHMLPKLMGPGAGDALREEVAAMMARQSPEAVIAALRAMAARPDSFGDLPGIDVPVLLIVGREDVITPPEDARAMRERLPRAELIEIPRAGHLPPLEEPGAFNAAVRNFLEQMDGGPGKHA